MTKFSSLRKINVPYSMRLKRQKIRKHKTQFFSQLAEPRIVDLSSQQGRQEIRRNCEICFKYHTYSLVYQALIMRCYYPAMKAIRSQHGPTRKKMFPRTSFQSYATSVCFISTKPVFVLNVAKLLANNTFPSNYFD